MAEGGDIDPQLSKALYALSIAREATVYFKFGNEPKKLNAYRCQGQGRECENIAIFYTGKYLCGERCSENYETKIRLFYCGDYDKDKEMLPRMPDCIWSERRYCRQHHLLGCPAECAGEQLLYCQTCGDVHFAKSQLQGQLNKYHAIISKHAFDQRADRVLGMFKNGLHQTLGSFDNPKDLMGTLHKSRDIFIDVLSVQYYTCVKYLLELNHLDMNDYKDLNNTPLDIGSLYEKYATCLQMPKLGYDEIMTKRETASTPSTPNGNGFYACSRNDCHMCPKFGPYFNIRINNSSTEELIQELNCNSDKVVYIISCHLCHMQYVGRTRTEIKTRYTKHRSDEKGALRKHFKNSHDKETADELECSIVAFVKESDEEDMKQKEMFWIDKSTKWPYGMNIRLG